MVKNIILIVLLTIILTPQSSSGFFSRPYNLKDTALHNPHTTMTDSSLLTISKDTIIENHENTLPTISTERSLFPVDFFTTYKKDSLKAAWYQYLSSIQDAGVIIKADEKQFITNYENANTTQTLSDNVIEKATPKTIAVGKITNYTLVDTALYTFYVQIAASRSPMDSAEIRRLYKGSQQILTQTEDGWHKYRFGKTSDYKEAFENLYSQKIPDAFIVVYKNNGEKMELWEVLREKRKRIVKNVTNSFEFRVQIVANKTQLTPAELDQIYKGDQTITEVQEDGWYKYQITSGKNYAAAKGLQKALNIEDAFIVAYDNNEKMELYKAILKTKNH